MKRNNLPSRRSQSVAKVVVSGNGPKQTAAPVGSAVLETGLGTLSVEFDNLTGTQPKTFILGDANGIYEAVSGLTLSDPTDADITPAALNASFANQPVLVGGINYAVTTSPSQFGQNFRAVGAERNGNSQSKKINAKIFSSSADNNENVRNLVFGDREMPRLSGNTGITLVVAAGEKVNFELSIYEALN